MHHIHQRGYEFQKVATGEVVPLRLCMPSVQAQASKSRMRSPVASGSAEPGFDFSFLSAAIGPEFHGFSQANLIPPKLAHLA